MDYLIEEANHQQRDYISNKYWRDVPKWQENRYNYFFYVATDIEKNIIGYIALEEKDVPVLPYGKDWFIVTIKVFESYKRKGIGTALLTYALDIAKELGVRNFQGSANPTYEAHMFWLKNQFSFMKYGKQHDDVAKVNECGNYSHMIFKRVDDVNIYSNDNNKASRFKYIFANQEQLDIIFSIYIEKECANIYKTNKDKIKAVIVTDEEEKNIGFITWLEMDLMSPLEGIQWCIPYMHIDSEYISEKLDIGLINELVKYAKDNNVQQLFGMCPNEDMFKYWYDLGFDIFVSRYLFQTKTGKNPIAIGRNLNDICNKNTSI